MFMIRWPKFDSSHINHNYSSLRYQGAQQLGRSTSVMIVDYAFSWPISLY